MENIKFDSYVKYSFWIVFILSFIFVIFMLWGWPGIVFNLFSFFFGAYAVYQLDKKEEDNFHDEPKE